MVDEDLTEDQIKNHIGVVSFALDDNTSWRKVVTPLH